MRISRLCGAWQWKIAVIDFENMDLGEPHCGSWRKGYEEVRR